MPRRPLLVVADDLTGAAEIAAIGHRHGLRASVVANGHSAAGDAELVVFDTDSRLDDARAAAKKISALGATLANQPRELIFKKIDSVLRGPVRAELEALAGSLGLSRVLLAPANPTLGRTLQSGRYAIRGIPLHETSFAHDPHHPVKTSEVRELLDNAGTLPVSIGNPQTPLPAKGIIVGDALSTDDLSAWARRAVPDLLLAGAADFFSALLHERGITLRTESPPPATEEPILVISGTTSSAGLALRKDARRAGLPIVPLPAQALGETAAAAEAFQNFAQAVRTALATRGRALAFFDGPLSSDTTVAGDIRRAFAGLAGALVTQRLVRHLLIEGGATAAAITRALDWHELRLTHAWSPGVASLRPAGNPAVALTLKPGSYAWPPALWQKLAGSGTKFPHA